MMPMSDPQPSGAFEWTQEPWGRALRCTRLPVPHIFTSRDLLLLHDADEWAAAAASLCVPQERLLLIHQVHGTDVAVARRGATGSWRRPEADVVVTDEPDVAIGVRVADCAPILLYDGRQGVAGAIHAGWRGAASNVAGAGVRALEREFGSKPRDIIAAIGPCLDACCGEVGPDVVAAFRSGDASNADVARWFTPGRRDRAFLDLPRVNVDQLVAAGVPPDQVFDSALCTKTHRERLHSYRAERGAAGRMLGAIRLPRR
jgi:YfiH family protein